MNKNHEKLQIKSMMSAQKSWNSHRVTDKSHGAFPSRNHKPTPISRRRRLQKGCSGQQQGRPTSIVDLWSSGPRGADWGAAWPFEDGRWRRNRRRMMMMMEGDGIVIIGSLVIRLVSSGLLSVAILRCHSASVYRTKSRNLVAWQGRRVVHGGVQLRNYMITRGRWACSTHNGPAIVRRAPIDGANLRCGCLTSFASMQFYSINRCSWS